MSLDIDWLLFNCTVSQKCNDRIFLSVRLSLGNPIDFSNFYTMIKRMAIAQLKKRDRQNSNHC